MASQSQGIQQLLAAEKRAAEKVGEARKSKEICVLFFHSQCTILEHFQFFSCEFSPRKATSSKAS